LLEALQSMTTAVRSDCHGHCWPKALGSSGLA
jgi:hypothetical protein